MKDSLLKHLKIYKLRRKIDINHCPELSVWAVFPTQRHTGHDDLKPELSSPDKALAWDSDPRTQEMGWRLVINSQVDPLDVVASCRKGETEDYHKHRYSIGKAVMTFVLKVIVDYVALLRHCNIAILSVSVYKNICN